MPAILAQSILFLIVACYAAYVLLELRMVVLYGKREKIRLTEMEAAETPPAEESLPPVSVLLPVYNESGVVQRLIDAVCDLEYPADKREILVLDDSTDATTALAQAKVNAHAARGVRIRLLRRGRRNGYKAGNLIHGMREATGDFLAFFDADCLPPRDFLLKSMPCFADPRVGFLQTGIRYTNRDASFLTVFQAMAAEHQQFVTVGLYNGECMASLSGNSCVWRRACIDDIGGISAETIAEDVDLGYRAQLQAWKYVFLRNVVSATELPEHISAFRVQRERWARGLIHNAARHVGAMFAAPMPAERRLHALSMMFSSLLLASFYLLLLLALPLTIATERLGIFFNSCCALFLLTAIVWVCANCAGSRRIAFPEKREPLRRLLSRAFAYAAMFLPLSLYYFFAAVRVLAGRKGGFHRTPKGKQREKHPPINTVLFSLELLSLAYTLVTLACAVAMRNYWVCLFIGIACSGFAAALFFSWQERRARRV
jgi:cellulose synthase (UDP-forming)